MQQRVEGPLVVYLGCRVSRHGAGQVVGQFRSPMASVCRVPQGSDR